MIQCPDCDGEGTVEIRDIEQLTIPTGNVNLIELQMLKQDAKKVKRDAEFLKKARPENAPRYNRQLNEALELLCVKAAKLL